jgi:signal transduction histidine kinase
MLFERHHLAWVLASSTTVACFAGATAYTQRRLSALDALASTLERNAIPSIEYLGRTGVRLTRLNQLLGQLASNRATAAAAARPELNALDDDVTRYLQLPPLQGEQRYWAALRANVNRARELSRAVFEDEETDASAVAHRRQSAEDAIDQAVNSVLVAVNSDTAEAEELAKNVKSVRAGTLQAVIALDAGSALVAAFAVVLAFRASRAHDALLNEHASLLSARVAELDTFAGRIAHDVVNPLGVIAGGLSLLRRSTDAAGRVSIDRSLRAVLRVQQLVDDLLAFARAGGRSDGSASSSVETVIDGMKPDLAEEAAAKGIALAWDVVVPQPVRCAPGVVTSIVQNLVRNAIKYMGTRPLRRIDVIARAGRATARIEIRDTGPGVAPELQATMFEPFVRGSHDGVAGSGLGLATVKRLVESHGGRVGIESDVGIGTLVWVELPLVAGPAGEGARVAVCDAEVASSDAAVSKPAVVPGDAGTQIRRQARSDGL